MHQKQAGFSVIEITLATALLIVLVAIGVLTFQKQKDHTLTSEQLNQKFSCRRVTADFRFTDVFCGDPKFYNNPDSITYDDYYKYQACEERLKNGPSAETAKMNDPGYYKAYYDCKDHAKLDNLRLEFIKSLKKLKAENS
jgi:hypothetical protein